MELIGEDRNRKVSDGAFEVEIGTKQTKKNRNRINRGEELENKVVGSSIRFGRMNQNRNHFIMNDISNNIVEPFKRDDDLLLESSLCIFLSFRGTITVRLQDDFL